MVHIGFGWVHVKWRPSEYQDPNFDIILDD